MSTPSLFDALNRVRTAESICLSPDGRTAAYAVVEVDAGADTYESSVWIAELSGAGVWRVGQGGSPSWSPDGRRLALVEPRRAGGGGVRILDERGQTVCRVDVAAHLLSGPVWARAGNEVLFAAESADAPSVRSHIVERAEYRSEGLGFVAERRSDLYLANLQTGSVRTVARNSASTFGPAWSPEGERVAFCRGDGPGSVLWILELATGRETRLNSDLPAAFGPAWSPNAELIACYATDDSSPGEDHRFGLFVIDVATGRWRRLGETDVPAVVAKAARQTQPPVWLSNTCVLFRVAQRGFIHLEAVELQGGRRTVIGGSRQVLSYDAQAGRICAIVSQDREPSAFYSVEPGSDVERQFAALNEGLAPAFSDIEVHPRTFQVAGQQVDGFLWRRPGADPRAPLAISLHGGPHAYSSAVFSLSHFYRYVLAQMGWAVLSPNITGSASYGRSFAEAIHGRWGDVDASEVIACAEALERAGEADPARWALVGYSYGGFLAAHLLAESTRFRAGVIGAPIVNFESFAGTSDIGPAYVARELALSPFAQREALARASPIRRAERVRSPTLLLHGEDDVRCPIGQSEELFSALQGSGRARVKYVRYPGAGHGLPGGGRPSQRLDYHQRVVAWLAEHVSKGSPQ